MLYEVITTWWGLGSLVDLLSKPFQCLTDALTDLREPAGTKNDENVDESYNFV